jgi:hypothetical protein
VDLAVVFPTPDPPVLLLRLLPTVMPSDPASYLTAFLIVHDFSAERWNAIDAFGEEVAGPLAACGGRRSSPRDGLNCQA